METISVGSNQFIEHAPPSEASAAMTPSLTWIEQNLSRERPLPVIALQSRFPVSRSTTRVRHGHDQDATSFDSINDAEWEALKQVPAGSMVERRLCFRRRTMADSAASISPLNAAAAVTLRSAYQRAAASASWRASSRYSSSRVTAGCGVDATTRFRPWNCHGGTGVDSIEPCPNLGRPRRFSVGVHFAFEALNQLASEGGALFVRKSKSFYQELLDVHTRHYGPFTEGSTMEFDPHDDYDSRDSRQSNGDNHGNDPRDDARWPDRDRGHDPRGCVHASPGFTARTRARDRSRP
jgi:hypothetical protein